MTNWFKVGRADRDKIITHCGEKSPGVLAVWLAFCDIANRARSSSFQSSAAELARACGMTSRTVERHLPVLKSLGLVTWENTYNSETKGLTANAYRLPTFHPTDTLSEPLPTQCRKPTDNDVGVIVGAIYRKTDKTGKKDGRLSATERISLEKNLDRLKKQERELKAEVSERYIRETCPEKIKELELLRKRIKDAESRLEAA